MPTGRVPLFSSGTMPCGGMVTAAGFASAHAASARGAEVMSPACSGSASSTSSAGTPSAAAMGASAGFVAPHPAPRPKAAPLVVFGPFSTTSSPSWPSGSGTLGRVKRNSG